MDGGTEGAGEGARVRVSEGWREGAMRGGRENG